uniref:Uncharacterized protein n=1 Tax=Bombyx mori TaxID=7091 RepID=A0A8R2M9M7_BOMMO|nr:uncharacterized protein LOC119630680 isoform X1 [Bombyx mori]XP_037876795.1 uncharacterized protein LOC119630680 isoform X1 [Bombyx mori]
MSMSVSVNNHVLLSTALIEVYNSSSNKRLIIRALLDSGSQTSLITSKVKNELNLTPQPSRLAIVGVGNQPLSNTMQRCSLKLRSKQTDFEADISCFVLPQISSNLPNSTFDASICSLPSNIKLADPNFNHSAPVDMLIGADLFWHLIESDRLDFGPNQPTALKSKLGWILSGPFVPKKTSNINSVQCNHVSFNSDKDTVSNDSLHNDLKKFWELEKIPTKKNILTADEIECENHFKNHTYRDEDGRFHVKLPLLAEPECLGNSYNFAKKQFLSLEKRLTRDANLTQMYSHFIKEYKDLGHLSESSKLIPEQSFFIPHHPIFRPTSESTKLRVVFNGSSKTTSGYSLNDLQVAGPHIQDSLFNILIRFRQYTYVLSGDVEKMYRMIKVQESDRDLQMILWRDNNTEPIKSFRLNTVTYGLTSSSFLSTRCLWQLGEECSDNKIKKIIQNDFVVDDLLTGNDSKHELIYIKKSVESALAAGCFNLRKYRSNLSSLLENNENTQKNLIISSSSHTLGVGWDPRSDIIHFPTNYRSNAKITKRSILSESCKVFDPLGILSIFTIKPKILIQKLWIEKVDWDEPAPQEIRQSWLLFIENMKHLHLLRIPRHVLCKEPSHIELHCFCDASQAAYAACIYLKSTNAQGDVTVRLLSAKARVASVKPTTIPRLELCACLLGAQLADAVVHALRCVIARKVYWTDSSIALAWLGARYDKLKTFVANRVAMILELTNDSEWRHVPTHLNPADLASRGVDTIKNDTLDIWWTGPTFLSQNESGWPSYDSRNVNINELPETKVHVSTTNKGVDENNKQPLIIDFSKYSKLKFLQRTFAYMQRFVYNCRNPRNKKVGILQPEELARSFRKLVYLAQADSFSKEINLLRSKGVLNSKNYLISLNPFLDSEGILRVGGRLTLSSYNFEKRHQMLLHAKHWLTKLLFQQEHLRLLHAGPQLLLYTVRESIWPIAGRDLARTTTRQCVKCRRISGKTFNPIMGSLPEQRVNPGFPFVSAAVDFAGPYLITDRKGRGCKITKCYLCLFVCLKYKCLHLEAVSELSKDAFILALRRFISRRGKPHELFCDNGRNFVGAAREIGDFLNTGADEVEAFSSGEGIKFNFQPAYSPHFGGLVEACVKSAKYHLKRMLGQTHLTFEELATLFSQIEAILNSRPLCPLSSSPNDLQPLTPGHFLIGRPLNSYPNENFADRTYRTRDRFLRLEFLRRLFWKRWMLEYITQLQARQKWRTPGTSLQLGDLVLLKEENAPPMHWKVGRITALFPGEDGVARAADVRTTTGTYRRGTRYLCPLLDPAAYSLEATASNAPEDVPAHC